MTTGTSDTIKTLVSQRSAKSRTAESAAESFNNPLTAHRNIEVIRTEEIYLFGITVVTGCGKISIDCGNKLKFNPELSEAVSEQAGNYLIQLPVFKELSKKGAKLSSRRAKIQEKYLRYARPYWYVNKKDMPALRDEICLYVDASKESEKSLMQLADELRSEALENYDDAHTEFLVGLEKIFRRSNLHPDEVSRLLMEYDAYFPSQEKITNNFGVLLEGPIKIPSLVEEAQRNADLAEALAREAAAENHTLRQEIERQTLNAERDAQLRQEQAIRELEQQWINSVQSSFAQGIEDARDEGYLFMAQMLERIEGVDPADLTKRTKDYLDGKLRSLQTCLNTLNSVLVNDEHPDPVLKRFAEVSRQLKVLTTASVDRERVQQRLNALREQMRDELAGMVAGSQSKGHRAIAKWMILLDENPSPTSTEATEAATEPAGEPLPPKKSTLILDDQAA